MSDSLVSVVIPAHNEAEGLPIVVASVASTLSAVSHEVIIVDDGSSDDTWTVIAGLADRFEQVIGLRLTRNFGHQAALLAGISVSRGAAVVTMDADGQHPIELLPEFLRHWDDGADVVQGVREGGDAGWFKHQSSKVFYGIANAMSGGVRVEPGGADYRLMSRRVVDQVLAAAGPVIFLRGLVPWLGFPTRRVHFSAKQRVAGRPSYDLRRMLRLSLDGILATSVVPLRLSVVLGLGVAVLAFLYMIYATGVRLFSDAAVPGWASMTGLLGLLGGVQLVTVGILGEYIGRLFLSQLGRPPFVVKGSTRRRGNLDQATERE